MDWSGGSANYHRHGNAARNLSSNKDRATVSILRRGLSDIFTGTKNPAQAAMDLKMTNGSTAHHQDGKGLRAPAKPRVPPQSRKEAAP